MERTILLKLSEEQYQQVLKLTIVLSQDQGRTFRPGDVIRGAIAFALQPEKKQ